MLTIGQVAHQARLRTSAIRYYERIGLLPAAARHNGRRRYTDDVLRRLTVIRFAREHGFTLEEIRRLFAGRPYSRRLRRLAGQKIAELEHAIERARTMQALLGKALRCKCLSLEECGRRLDAAQQRRARGSSGA